MTATMAPRPAATSRGTALSGLGADVPSDALSDGTRRLAATDLPTRSSTWPWGGAVLAVLVALIALLASHVLPGGSHPVTPVRSPGAGIAHIASAPTPGASVAHP